MQFALRRYHTAGVAIVGAGMIAVATTGAAAPCVPAISTAAVQLTAGGDLGLTLGQLADLGDPSTDPLGVYTDLFQNSFTNLQAIGTERLTDPAPILGAVVSNWEGYFSQAVDDPSSITNIPTEMFGNMSNVFSQLTSLSPDITFDAPILGNLTALFGDLQTLVAHPLATLESYVADLLAGDPVPLVTDAQSIIADLGNLPLATLNVILPPAIVMGLAGLGPLVNFGDAASTLFTDLSDAGTNPMGALETLISAPGYLADATLNGTWGLNLETLGVADANLPIFDGLLVPWNTDSIQVLGDLLQVNLGPFTGLSDGFVNYLPQVIAGALLGDTTFPLDPATTGDFGSLSELANLGDLAGLLGGSLDPTGLFGDLTGLVDPSDFLSLLSF